MNAERFAVVWIPNDQSLIGGVCNDKMELGYEHPRIYDTMAEAEAEREEWHAVLGQQRGQYRVVAIPRPTLQDFLA